MQHSFKAILRLAQYQSLILGPLRRYSSAAGAPRIVAFKAFDVGEDITMGKDKVQFLLKTPKGTKDCRYRLLIVN